VIGPGSTLAHYEVVSALGKGGMGEVWRAKDTKLGREVAIKTLPAEFAQDADRLARFEREAKLLASLNHPNIAAIHGFEEDAGTHFLVMELVEGDTLADRVGRGAIPVEESLKLALQIADALKAAHEKGVIHRDLKPANIKVTDDNSIKVLDFGLAKAFAGEDVEQSPSNSPTLSMQATQQGVILGTAAYMSPEQAKGRTVDKRADVWAFGCVLYEMLTGRQSFGASDVTESLAAVIRAEPKWTTLPEHLHPRCRETVERCLEKQVAKRYQDIGDVKVDIERLLNGDAGPVAGTSAEFSRSARPSNLAWVAILIAGFIVAGLAAWTLKPAPPAQVSRMYHLLDEGDRLEPRGGALALSPDGSTMVYVARDVGALRSLFVRSMDDFLAHPIDGVGNIPGAPAISRDGEWVAYQEIFDESIKIVGMSGGAPVPLVDVSRIQIRLHWTDDDTIIYVSDEGIMEVSKDGGVPVLLVEVPVDEEVDSPQMLPGRKGVIATNTGPNQTASESNVVVYSIESGEKRTLFPGQGAQYLPTGHLVYSSGETIFAVAFDADTLEALGGAVSMGQGIQPGQFAFSDSGSFAYLEGTGATGGETLALIDRDGNITPLDVPANSYQSPRLSPDGRRLAVQTTGPDGSRIWTYDLSDGNAIRPLTLEGNNYRPIWTRDGERITFASDRDGTTSIYWQPADGSGAAEPLTNADEGTVHLPTSWSPDGTLAFVSADGNVYEDVIANARDSDIWTVSPSGDGDPQPFTAEDESVEMGAQFSHDGNWIAYSSNPIGNVISSQLYVEPFPPVPGVRYQLTQNTAVFPVWSLDDSELFFRPTQTIPILKRIGVTREPAFSWGAEEQMPIENSVTVSHSRDYDITPDGEQFIVVLPTDQQDAGRIPVVLNWFEELKERVPIP
jgi:hypothetical protein